MQLNDQLTEDLLDELMEEIDEDRTDMHPSVTDLINCLTKSYFDNLQKLPLTTKTKVFFFVGLGLERALLLKRKGIPTYGKTEGIHWHVDSLDHGLLELKSTRAGKKRHLEEDFPWRYMAQVKSYLKATGNTEVDLAVVYLIQADFQVYHLTFTQDEIDDHWFWMQSRKAVWDKAIEDKEAPESFKWNQEWECKDCQYKIICDLRKDQF